MAGAVLVEMADGLCGGIVQDDAFQVHVERPEEVGTVLDGGLLAWQADFLAVQFQVELYVAVFLAGMLVQDVRAEHIAAFTVRGRKARLLTNSLPKSFMK